MKDIFDLHWLSHFRSFDGKLLTAAVRSTFKRRGTSIPDAIPIALTQEFGENTDKNIQWNAFIRKGKLEAPSFPEVIARISKFLIPVLSQDENQTEFHWDPDLGWSDHEIHE